MPTVYTYLKLMYIILCDRREHIRMYVSMYVHTYVYTHMEGGNKRRETYRAKVELSSYPAGVPSDIWCTAHSSAVDRGQPVEESR